MNVYKRCAVVVICSILTNSSIYAQSLKAYIGAGAGCDVFIRNKQTTINKSGAPLTSGQLIGGLRYKTQQTFDIMLDLTLGLSRINMPTDYRGSDKLIYEQARSLMTIGSGLNVDLENEEVIMPYIQIGIGFYDYRGVTQKTSSGKFGTASDYDRTDWAPVCGAGIEYSFHMLGSSSLNLRFLYTPTDIYSEPVKYDIYGQTSTGKFELQGKLLQFILSYQINLTVFKRDNY